MDNIKKLTKKIIKFRDERDWKKFQNAKDCSISLALEAAELLEHFQWKNNKEVKEYINKNKEEVSDELADVFYWVLLICHDLKIDIEKAVNKKLKKNILKYPVEKARGVATKYNKL